MYIIHVYNLFSYPITYCETWLIIVFFHLKSLFRNLSYQSHSKFYEYKWSVLIPINIHHHTLGITSLVFYTFPLIIFVYEQSVVCWRYYFYLNGFRADTLDNLVKKVWWFVVIYCFTDICTTQNNRCIVFIYKKPQFVIMHYKHRIGTKFNITTNVWGFFSFYVIKDMKLFCFNYHICQS